MARRKPNERFKSWKNQVPSQQTDTSDVESITAVHCLILALSVGSFIYLCFLGMSQRFHQSKVLHPPPSVESNRLGPLTDVICRPMIFPYQRQNHIVFFLLVVVLFDFVWIFWLESDLLSTRCETNQHVSTNTHTQTHLFLASIGIRDSVLIGRTSIHQSCQKIGLRLVADVGGQLESIWWLVSNRQSSRR